MKKFLICMMVMAVVFATACSKAEPTEQMDGVQEGTVQVETNTDNAPKVANTQSQTTKNTKVKRVKTEPIKDESAPEGATMPTKDGISGTAWQNEYESLVFDDKGNVTHTIRETNESFTGTYELRDDGTIIIDGADYLPIQMHGDKLMFNGDEMTQCSASDIK